MYNCEYSKYHWIIHFKDWIIWCYVSIKLLLKKKKPLHKQFPLQRKKYRKFSFLSSPQQCKFKYLPLIMWKHYRKFFREIREVIVYEVQSPTILMFFCQFRMTQAIFRNAFQKNALKNFILNIHELKISIQARENAWKIQFFSLLRTLLFWLRFDITTLKRVIWKDGSSPSSPPVPLAICSCFYEAPLFLTDWSAVWFLRALCCALSISKIDIFSLRRIPKSISLTQIFLLCSRSQIFNCLMDRSSS